MNKKQKAITIIKLCYLLGMLIFVIGFPILMICLKKEYLNNFFYISIGYIIVIIILYLIYHFIRIKTYEYICPKCNENFSINVMKDITAYATNDNKLVLTCPKCGVKEVMNSRVK